MFILLFWLLKIVVFCLSNLSFINFYLILKNFLNLNEKMGSHHSSNEELAQKRDREVEEFFLFQGFFADCRDLESWIHDMKAIILADELAEDVAGAKALLERHQEHEGEIKAKRDSFRATAEFGKMLLDKDYYAVGDVKKNLVTLASEKSSLMSLWEERRILYEQRMDVLRLFYRDTEQADTWMTKQKVHNSSNECNIDLITVGKQHPLSVPKKPKGFQSGTKTFLSRNNNSKTHKLLKPATNVCPAQLGIGINNLKGSVNKENNSALELGEANPSVSTSLQNPSTIKNEITDFISDIRKAQYYAYVLRSLPDDQLGEVEKEISGILVHSQISAATGLDESQAISMWHASNQLPSLSKESSPKEPDIFDIKAQSYLNILRNLPKEKIEEVDRDISHILMQAQIAAWEKSQDDINSEYTRKPLYVLNRHSRSQKQGLPSPRKEKDGFKFGKSPKKKHLYPPIPNPEFNGDWNKQEYEDFSDEEHERATAYQENEEFIDDACEEELYNEEMLHKPLPKKPVTSTRNVQRRTPERTSKLHKDQAVPKPSTSYSHVKKIVCTLVVLLCAIAAAFFGASYWPKILENFSKTNSSPQLVTKLIQNLKNEFVEQPPMTFKVINVALGRVTKPNPEEPAIILLLTEQGAEDVAGRFARRIADSVSSTNDVVVVSGDTFQTKDPDEAKKGIDDFLTENLSTDRLKVVLVERLDYIPYEVAGIFHTYFDHENAPFKQVVYLITIVSTKTQLQLSTSKEWDIIAHERLSEVWSKGGNDQISSFLSRLTVSVAAIVPGG